ncbi:MAG TPA: ABC transporter ATP-binding protein, partial [Polymorphobacter sp.]|nr:ABC transporter ATP-binding protein [Polymorphobacter sp.]
STLMATAQEKILRVIVDRELTEVPPGFVATLLGPRTLSISYDKRHSQVGAILTALADAGLGIVDVSTQEPDLEDVFLSFTRRDGVDA